MTSLTDIARHRYQTGEYGNAHIQMCTQDWHNTRTARPAPTPPPAWSPEYDPMAQLLSIPIVLDESVPAGRWRLVDNSTRDVITEGTFDA